MVGKESRLVSPLNAERLITDKPARGDFISD